MLLDPKRNEPCLCGSGRKFKDCCLKVFEDTRRWIKREIESRLPTVEVHASFVEVLAAACAIAGDDLETPLPLETALAGAVRVLESAFGGEEPSAERLLPLQDLLTRTLRENPELRDTRYDPRRFIQVLNDLDVESGQDTVPEGDSESGEAGPLTGEALRRLHQPGLAEDFALDLYWALRAKPEGDELDGILWGLVGLTTPGMSCDNPLMVAVFDVTFDELAAAQEEMETLMTGAGQQPGGVSGGPDPRVLEEFPAFLDRHPLMARAISDDVLDAISEALDAVAGGKVALRLPAWTMLGGLRYLAENVSHLFLSEHSPASGSLTDDEKLLLGFDLREVGLEEDWEVFVPAAQECLRQACSDPEVSRALRVSLEALAEQLGTALLEANRLAFQIVYQEAIGQMLTTDPVTTGLPPGDPFNLSPLDLLDEERMRAYSRALKASGQEKAALRVERFLPPPGESGRPPGP